ncbi:MAG: metallophosphoesterase, partial [Deltaproteobacteria bacterium]|nr:metallophosphoesterase [Deltaproteobacteria bacterium]
EASSRRVGIKHHRIAWPISKPIKVAHLTDLHVGWGTPTHALRRASSLCRAAKPDLTVMTGDYLNMSLRHLATLRYLVRRLPRPCVATLGNHDHWSDAKAITRALEAEGVIVLSNAHLELKLKGADLPVVGVDDGYTKHADVERAFAGLGAPERALVLTHLPETLNEIACHQAPLVLAGHTHGGQVHLPKITAAIARAAGHDYLAGWYRKDKTRLYVNAGIGSSGLRLRVGKAAQPEVAIFDLVPTHQGGVSHG